ncbi:MAG: hypothetical protein Q4B08_08440 [Propionibacteriaceae bacterium]|nr:hypothetical protein [Propionibacteriaceae bacterium]
METKKAVVRLNSKVWALALVCVQSAALVALALGALRWFLVVEVGAFLLLGATILSKFAGVLGQIASQQRQLDRIQASIGRAQWETRQALTDLRTVSRAQARGSGLVSSRPVPAAKTSDSPTGPVIGRAAGDSTDSRSREELFLDVAGSAVQRLAPRPFAVVIGPGQRVPESMAGARRLSPGFVTMQLNMVQPSGVIVDEAAFAEGLWAGADRSGGEHLVADLRQMAQWCADQSVSLVLVRRAGAVGENTSLIRSLTSLHVPLEKELPDGIPAPAVVRGALDLASKGEQ